MTTLSVQQFLAKNGMTPMTNPPHSPDLSPSHFFSLPQMKKVLKGKHFADMEEVKQKNSRSTKTHQNQRVKTVLNNGKNVLIGVLHKVENTLKVTEV